MDNVLMIVVVLAIALYPRQDTFIDKFKIKVGLKGVEVDLSTKEKTVHPEKVTVLKKNY